MEVKTSDVIIPLHPHYLPRHAPLILQRAGIQRAGIRWPKTYNFSLLSEIISPRNPTPFVLRINANLDMALGRGSYYTYEQGMYTMDPRQ